MSQRVPADEIERIVGAARHATKHYARAVSYAQTVYVLHSRACKDSGIDRRDCEFSIALDQGINPERWDEDVAHVVEVINGELMPIGYAPTGPVPAAAPEETK